LPTVTMQKVSDLRGKTVFVTGAARRLGRATALAAAKAGAQVAFTYLSSANDARNTLKQIDQIGKGFAVPCDVSKAESVAEAVGQVLDRFGQIDVLVNNAGIFEGVPFEELTETQWDRMFATNVRGPFLVSRHCIPALRRASGRIIHMGSLGGVKPWATHAHYCSSKAALHMLTEVMAKALAPEIAVNCVAPGMIDLGEGEGDLVFFSRMSKQTPMQRNGTQQDVVSAVMYFASAPHFITGQVLTVDGGLALR
jgi:NAD(P)-dependent dehydrogenase (short-subunit alcohol dehydrogenase family)